MHVLAFARRRLATEIGTAVTCLCLFAGLHAQPAVADEIALTGKCDSEAISAGDALYAKRIVVSSEVADSQFFRPALADLKQHLQAITGQMFASAPDGDGGISFLLTRSSSVSTDLREMLSKRGPEAFIICGSSHRLSFVANDPHGLAHAAYFYLERLGVRWLMPSDRWTIAPNRSDITLSVNELVEPAYSTRDYFGTGGFWSWRWSRRYQGSNFQETNVQRWKRRMRYSASYSLARSVGEGFIADPKILPILAAHPDYLARVGGQYSPLYTKNSLNQRELNVNAKINAGNPDAVALFCKWAIDRLRVARAAPDRILHDVFSVEPSDGYGYGDNIDELPGDGSPSDQSFYIANSCAKQAATDVPGASAILYAYAGHAAPPSFAIEPNVIVQLVPYAFQSTRPDRFIAQWKSRAKQLALYDYWSIPDWSFDEPTFNFNNLPARLSYWRANKIEGLMAESTYGAGAMGIGHYLAAHLMWNTAEDAKAITQDWFDSAFGAARVPVQRMYNRWAQAFRLTSDEISKSLADLSEARHTQHVTPAQMGRLADMAAYVHYLRLRLELINAPDLASKGERAVALAEFMLDIHDRGMVHTTRNMDLLANRWPEVGKEFALGADERPGDGWARVRRMNDEELLALIDSGRDAYPPPSWSQVSYRGELQYVGPASNRESPSGTFGPAMTVSSNVEADLIISRGGGGQRLRVTRSVDNDIEIHDLHERVIASRHVRGGARNEWVSFDLDLAPGRYRLKFYPTGGRATGHFSFQTSSDVGVVLGRFLTPKFAPSPRLYFFVPRGLRKIVMFYPDTDLGGAFKFRIRNPSGDAVELNYSDNRRIIEAEVLDGQDGRVWSIENSVSFNTPFEMLTAPQAFSLTAETAMTPVDSLAREGATPKN